MIRRWFNQTQNSRLLEIPLGIPAQKSRQKGPTMLPMIKNLWKVREFRYPTYLLVFQLDDFFSDNRPEILTQGFLSTQSCRCHSRRFTRTTYKLRNTIIQRIGNDVGEKIFKDTREDADFENILPVKTDLPATRRGQSSNPIEYFWTKNSPRVTCRNYEDLIG